MAAWFWRVSGQHSRRLHRLAEGFRTAHGGSHHGSELGLPHMLAAGAVASTLASTWCFADNSPVIFPLSNLGRASQVGGHVGVDGSEMLKMDGWILKPMQSKGRGERELQFYERVHEAQEGPLVKLQGFIPKCAGSVDIRGTKYIVLEDIANGFEHPSIADLKMGTQTWPLNAPAHRIAEEKIKYPPQAKLGFRFVGMQVYRTDQGKCQHYDKYYGRGLTKKTVTSGFEEFIHDGALMHYEVLEAVLAELRELLGWFVEQSEYRFFSSSILIVYDPPSASSPPKVRLKLIDFTHAHPMEKEGDLDSGYILGLKNAIKAVEKVLKKKRKQDKKQSRCSKT